MGDSGATYLGGELDPVHGVLRAVVVGGAPVQVELAEPVGPAERPAPQHCGGWGDAGSARPALRRPQGQGDAAPARGPVCGAKARRAGLPHRARSPDAGERRSLPSALLVCSFYYA